MFPFQRFVITALAVVGFLGALDRPARGGPISLSVRLVPDFVSRWEADATTLGLHVDLVVEPGWYFDQLSFTGMADQNGNSLTWYEIMRAPLWRLIDEWGREPYGGSASGYYAEVNVFAETPLGVYDRDPENLMSPAALTAYVIGEGGAVASTTVALSLEVPAVPEPASALLLGLGLMIPGGAVWLRRRRAA